MTIIAIFKYSGYDSNSIIMFYTYIFEIPPLEINSLVIWVKYFRLPYIFIGKRSCLYRTTATDRKMGHEAL